jgi:hypothetical protein
MKSPSEESESFEHELSPAGLLPPFQNAPGTLNHKEKKGRTNSFRIPDIVVHWYKFQIIDAKKVQFDHKNGVIVLILEAKAPGNEDKYVNQQTNIQALHAFAESPLTNILGVMTTWGCKWRYHELIKTKHYEDLLKSYQDFRQKDDAAWSRKGLKELTEKLSIVPSLPKELVEDFDEDGYIDISTDDGHKRSVSAQEKISVRLYQGNFN